MEIDKMKFTDDIPEPLRVDMSKYIGQRFTEIIQVWNYWLEHCVKYISFTNAGGIIAMLTFMNSRNIRAFSWPGLALLLFAIGLILVGITVAYMFHRMKKAHDQTEKDASEFYSGKITWGQFIEKVDKFKKFNIIALWLGWGAGVCFFVGLVIGIISFITYDCF